MIKAVITSEAGPTVLFLGLSRANVEKLLAGEPLIIHTALPPPKGLGLSEAPIVFLAAGETEDELAQPLEQWIGENTVRMDLRRSHSPDST